jgi:hypothetical protein
MVNSTSGILSTAIVIMVTAEASVPPSSTVIVAR